VNPMKPSTAALMCVACGYLVGYDSGYRKAIRDVNRETLKTLQGIVKGLR
jgi:hypothetical protein